MFMRRVAATVAHHHRVRVPLRFSSNMVSRSVDDRSNYGAYVNERSQEAARSTTTELQGFFDRKWVTPQSVFDLPMIQHLSTGKYRTEYRGTGLMKDPTSLVIYTQLLQKLRPKTIFDLGTCGGGSALWLADQCRSLGLDDTTVLTMDIEDFRTDSVKAMMDKDPNIRFIQGDAFKVGDVVRKLREEGTALEHPWLVSEDCHLDALPLMIQFRFAGMQAGDYWVFEDTHPCGPDESGMSGEDPANYRCEDFGMGKYRQLCWAMTVFPGEYSVDTELQDMFGKNASFMVNSVLKQVPAPSAGVAAEVQYTNSADLEASSDAIQSAIADYGHCVLRYAGPESDSAEDIIHMIPTIRQSLGIVATVDYAAAGGSDVRPPVGKDAIQATDFPPTSVIPPHHELHYSPKCPDRVGFVCLAQALTGGNTTAFDGKRALAILEENAAKGCEDHAEVVRRIHSGDRVTYRSTLKPPSQSSGESKGNTVVNWGPLFGDSEPEAALDQARKAGYTAELLENGNLQLDFTPPTLCPRTGALNFSAGAQAPLAYDVFYRDNSPVLHENIWWESDGEPVSEQDMLIVMGAYAQSKVFFEWQRPGDAVLLDNGWMAHGRMPFCGGERHVAVVSGNTFQA